MSMYLQIPEGATWLELFNIRNKEISRISDKTHERNRTLISVYYGPVYDNLAKQVGHARAMKIIDRELNKKLHVSFKRSKRKRRHVRAIFEPLLKQAS